jgi:AcrR family transcriptional regulator
METTPPQTRLPAEQRQAEMVQAVLKLAARQEPASITTTHIASEIGLSQGAVFRHFPNKEAVWLVVAEWLETTLLDIIRGAIRQDIDPLENLAAVFHTHIRFVQENPGVPRFIFHELQQPADSPVKQKVAAMLQAYSGILVGQLRQAKAASLTYPQLDEQSAAMLFIGSLQGLVMQSMLAGPAVLQRASAGVLNLYFRAIQRGEDA